MNTDFPDIDAIIIAAGSSSRIGAFKPLLDFGEGNIIDTIIQKLRASGTGSIVVVSGCNYQLLEAKLKDYPVSLVVNRDYRRGMLSSIQSGLGAVSGTASGVLICLVDQPFVKLDTLREIIAAFADGRAGIILPSYRGKHGHPVIISTKYFAEVFELDDNIGLRQLIGRHRDDIHEVAVSSDDVLRDIDTWEDYQRELAMSKEQ